MSTWVLDTSTKGTGATMVPLKKAAPSGSKLAFTPPPRRRSVEDAPPAPRGPRRFKVVDIMTRQVLADGADARATLQALRDVRSVVDVAIYVWQPQDGRWRPLTFEERRALWGQRDAATHT